MFVDHVVRFLIVAFAVSMLVRARARLQRTKKAAPPPPLQKECPFCYSTIALKATRCSSCTSDLPAAA